MIEFTLFFHYCTYSTKYMHIKCFFCEFQKLGTQLLPWFPTIRSSRPGVLLRKRVPKICSKFTGKHPCGGAISIKLRSNFIEIALWHGRSPVNLLHIFRTSFPRNTSGWLCLNWECLVMDNTHWNIYHIHLSLLRNLND